MSEKRFTLEQWTEESLYFSDGEYSAHMSIEYICKKVEKKLNEQQSTIDKLEEENEELRKQCFELEKDYLIETSDISDKIYLGDEIKELKQRYGVDDE